MLMFMQLAEVSLHRVCHKLLGLLALLCTGHLSPTVIADTIDTKGMAPYEACGYCHEYDGNSRMPQFPKLAGQQPAYLVKQILDFKHERRDGKGMMQEAVAALSSEDIDAVAQHFAAQTRLIAPQKLSAEIKNQASTIYNKGVPQRQLPACVSCHQPQNSQTPELYGQHARYLTEQLVAFKQKQRSNDAGVMQAIAAALDENEILALSEFLAAGGQ